MNWTVELKASYIPCPPEHVPAYWAALKKLFELVNQSEKSEELPRHDKRPPGSGSIYRLKNGTWRALATLEGRRISHTAKTQKECRDWLDKTLAQIDLGLTLAGAQTAFSQVLDNWLSMKKSKLRGATQEQYSFMVTKYLNPHLGSLPVKDLNAARIQAFYGVLQSQGVGARTIEVIHTILHGCLKHAQRVGLITQNWAALAEAPRPEKHEMKVWSEAQVSAFLASAPDPAFYRLAFATGMRRGELIGLKWDDLDWQTGALMVRRQVFEPAGGGWKFQEPKTDRGKRTIRIGPGLVEALRAQYLETLPFMRGFAGERWTEHDLIFPSSVGTPRRGYEVSKKFRSLITISGLPAIRFHDIRHTAASLMLLHNEPPIRVAAILGQSLAVLLETYAHYIPDDQESASALMDQITSPIKVDLSRADRARKGA